MCRVYYFAINQHCLPFGIFELENKVPRVSSISILHNMMLQIDTSLNQMKLKIAPERG